MTIPASPTEIAYAGNGITTAFPIPFVFDTSADILVVKTDSAGTPAVLSTGFSITGGGGATGTLTMDVAPAALEKLYVIDDPAQTQPTDYTNNDAFPADAHEAALDRVTRLVKRLKGRADRCIRVADGDDVTGNALLLPVEAARANKILGFDVLGQPIAVTATGGADSALRTDLASSVSTSEGARLIATRQTIASAAARSVFSKLNQIFFVEDCGAVGDNVTDDYLAIQATIDGVSALGGGTVALSPGKTYRTTREVIVKDSVMLEGSGARLRATLSSVAAQNDCGIRWRTNSIIQNLEVTVESSGSPGSQTMAHCAAAAGPISSAGGTVASPSIDHSTTNFIGRNLKLSTDKAAGSVAVQINGGVSNGIIENVEVPASAVMFGAFTADWDYVGTLNSSDIPTARIAFDAGLMYTLHPKNVVARNWKVGALTRAKAGIDTGSRLTRLSGTINCRAENFFGDKTTYASVQFTVGDTGNEFAPAVMKPFVGKGNRFVDIRCLDCTDGYNVLADSWADNVDTAISGGYVARTEPIVEVDVEFVRCQGKGSGGASAVDGCRFDHIRGGKLIDCNSEGFDNGVLFDAYCFSSTVNGGNFSRNRSHGVKFHHATQKPEDCVLTGDPILEQNGQAVANCAGFWIEGSKRAVVRNVHRVGHRTPASETTQFYGGRIAATTAEDFTVDDVHVRSAKAGGIGLSVLSGTDYGFARLIRQISYDASVSTKYAGLNVIPVAFETGPDGITRHQFIASKASLTADRTPTSGAWTAGDWIRFIDGAAGSNPGTACTATGSPGTWNKLANVEA
jgi:hypothetical protein